MKSEKTKFILTLFAVLIFCVASVSGCYLLYNSVSVKRQGITGLKSGIFEYESRIRNAKTLGESLAKVEKQRQEIDRVLYGGSIVNFIEELEYLAEKTGVDLKIMSIDSSERVSKGLIFRLNLDGTFLRLYHFLFLLENEHFQVELGRLFFNRAEKGNIWTADLDVKLLNFNKNEF